VTVEWYFSGHSIGGLGDLIRGYGEEEFDSPLRSNVPSLAYWATPETSLPEFLKGLGLAVPDAAKLDFEHKVPVQAGLGKPSYTDLMISADGLSVAVEAKFTEGRYADVETWLGKSTGDNRHSVLSGWLGLLERCSLEKLYPDSVAELPYQLVHRAASACRSDAPVRCLVYQVFDLDTEKRETYMRDLAGLRDVLGSPSPGLDIYLVPCRIDGSGAYERLVESWESDARQMHAEVIAGLLSGDLLRVELGAAVAV
jgi:hypothetical protein